ALLREVLTGPGRLDRELSAAARTTLTELAIDEGRADVAVTSARMSLEAAEAAGTAHLVWRARRLLAVGLGMSGSQAEAEEEFRRTARATHDAGALPELARCLNQWTALRASAGIPPADETSSMLLNQLAETLERLPGRTPMSARETTQRVREGAMG